MKKILPFKGMLYNQDKITSMADVVSPPYDVINADLQETLYAKSDYNFCRVDLTKETGDERYDIAGKRFEEWVAADVLKQDEEPAIYIHHHSFTLPNGKKVTRKGFFAARRIEDFSEGGIKPHEKTLDGPKADRLNMTRATECNLSPVFSLYSDSDLQIDAKLERLVQTTAQLDFSTDEGHRHQLWKMKDKEVCGFIDQHLADRPLFIADGHHRYETALNYRNETIEKQGELSDSAASKFLLMYFSNMNDEGMVILPIHRALHSLSNHDLPALLEKLGEYFEVTEVKAEESEKNLAVLAENTESEHRFWLLAKDGTSYLLSLSREKWLNSEIAKTIPETLVPLDVTVLHRLIFKEILGLSDEAQAKQENIIYWKSTERALAETTSGKCDVTFILNSTRIEDMESVAMSGEKMPQKSTFFYPKIISGLVMHRVNAELVDGLV